MDIEFATIIAPLVGRIVSLVLAVGVFATVVHAAALIYANRR